MEDYWQPGGREPHWPNALLPARRAYPMDQGRRRRLGALGTDVIISFIDWYATPVRFGQVRYGTDQLQPAVAMEHNAIISNIGHLAYSNFEGYQGGDLESRVHSDTELEFMHIDIDGNGRISRQELYNFLTTNTNLEHGTDRALFREMWDSSDADASGWLDAAELQDLLNEWVGDEDVDMWVAQWHSCLCQVLRCIVRPECDAVHAPSE